MMAALNPYEQARAVVDDLDEYRKQRELAKKDITILDDKLKAYSGYSDGQKATMREQKAQAERYLNLSEKELQATYGLSPDQLTQEKIRQWESQLPAIAQKYPPLDERQVGTPLKDTKAMIYGQLDQQPSASAPIRLTEAQILAATRDRRGIDGTVELVAGYESSTTPSDRAQKISEALGPRGGPLKDTLDKTLGPDHIPPQRPAPFLSSSKVPTAPPPPTFGQWAQETIQGVVDAVQKRLPYTPPPPTIEPQLEQLRREQEPQTPTVLPADPHGTGAPTSFVVERRPTVEDYWKQQQAQHEQGFARHMDQYYEQQPPGTPTPAPQQPGHMKDLLPPSHQSDPTSQPSTPPKPTLQQQGSQPGHFRDMYYQQGEQLKDIERGLEQIKQDIAKEQGQQPQTPHSSSFRQMFDQPPKQQGEMPPDQQRPQEPEQGHSR